MAKTERNSGLDGCGLYVCWNPDCQCRCLLPKSRRLPFSGFLPLDVSSPAVGDILRSGCCRCVCCRGSQRTVSSSVQTASYLGGACVLLLCDWPALGQLRPDWSVSISLFFVIKGFTLNIFNARCQDLCIFKPSSLLLKLILCL